MPREASCDDSAHATIRRHARGATNDFYGRARGPSCLSTGQDPIRRARRTLPDGYGPGWSTAAQNACGAGGRRRGVPYPRRPSRGRVGVPPSGRSALCGPMNRAVDVKVVVVTRIPRSGPWWFRTALMKRFISCDPILRPGGGRLARTSTFRPARSRHLISKGSESDRCTSTHPRFLNTSATASS